MSTGAIDEEDEDALERRAAKADRRGRKFFALTFGNLLAVFAFAGGGIGVYTSVIAEVNNHKLEISNLKDKNAKDEQAAKESRQEIKNDVKDVKNDVKEVNQKLDRLIDEFLRQRTQRR